MRAAVAILLLGMCCLGARAAGTTEDQTVQQIVAQAVQNAMSQQGLLSQGMGNFHSSMGAITNTMQTVLANSQAQAEAALAAFEAQYCTPASFTPSEKVPAKFVGHSMSITFDMGSCTFNESRWIHDGVKELNCTEPSISYVKSPANFTSKFHSAPAFTSKECKVSKKFGESVEKVLFVFDGQQAPDVNSLTTKITQEVKNMLSTMQSGASDLISNAKAAASGMFNPIVPGGAAATTSATTTTAGRR